SADLRMALKSSAKLKHLAPEVICVADPLAFCGCGRNSKKAKQVQEPSTNGHSSARKAVALAYRTGIARAMFWGERPVHPVTRWRRRLSVALDALQTNACQNGTDRCERRSPVETTNVQLPTGDRLLIPTGAETLRLQGYLIMCRNSSRDYAEL